MGFTTHYFTGHRSRVAHSSDFAFSQSTAQAGGLSKCPQLLDLIKMEGAGTVGAGVVVFALLPGGRSRAAALLPQLESFCLG